MKFSILFYTKIILVILCFTRWRIGQPLDSDPSAMRVTIRMGRGYSFCVALSLFESSVSLQSDKLNLLYIKSVLSITIQSFQNFNTLSSPLFSVFLATDYFSAPARLNDVVGQVALCPDLCGSQHRQKCN